MSWLEIMGILFLIIVAVSAFWKVYCRVFPKKYTPENCPQDHDTLNRYGAKRCDTCGNEFWKNDEDEN
jgi:ABC-type nickel/cobalt efflux system permease component RcnA